MFLEPTISHQVMGRTVEISQNYPLHCLAGLARNYRGINAAEVMQLHKSSQTQKHPPSLMTTDRKKWPEVELGEV